MGKISMPQGKGSLMHNRRAYEEIGHPMPNNIDQKRTSENIVYVDRPDLHAAYEEIFGEALKKYNDKQTRADRRIPDYLDHIKKSKNGEKVFYENIIQWGKREDFVAHPELRGVMKGIFDEYIATWEKRNPNLILVGAYLHMDEASPHLHVDYVPVAHGYKRGLECRNSLDRAYKEMGYKPKGAESKDNNATMVWKASERSYFGMLCRKAGLDIEPEEKSDHSYLIPSKYGKVMDDIHALEKQRDELKGVVDALEADLSAKSEQVHILDAVNAEVARNGSKRQIVNMIIPGEKAKWGRSGTPDRQGAFIEGVDGREIVNELNKAAASSTITNQIDIATQKVKAAEQRISELQAQEQQIMKEINTAEFLYSSQMNYMDAVKELANEPEVSISVVLLKELASIRDINLPVSRPLAALLQSMEDFGNALEDLINGGSDGSRGGRKH